MMKPPEDKNGKRIFIGDALNLAIRDELPDDVKAYFSQKEHPDSNTFKMAMQKIDVLKETNKIEELHKLKGSELYMWADVMVQKVKGRDIRELGDGSYFDLG